MADITQYWALVAEERARILQEKFGVDVRGFTPAQIKSLATNPEYSVYITSVSKPLEGMKPGITSGVSVEVAARRTIEATHRLSNEAEIKQFHADQKRRSDQCAAITFRTQRDKGGVNLSIDGETALKHGLLPALPSEEPPEAGVRKGK